MKHLPVFALLALGACTANEVTSVCREDGTCMDTYRDAHGGMFAPVVTGEVLRGPDGKVAFQAQATQAPAVVLTATVIGGAAVLSAIDGGPATWGRTELAHAK